MTRASLSVVDARGALGLSRWLSRVRALIFLTWSKASSA